MNQGVRLQVLSSFESLPGTLVVDEEEIVEKQVVSGIAYSRDEAKIAIIGVADRPGVAAGIFGPLSEANINVDMIVQNVAADGELTDMTFPVGKAAFERALQVLEGVRTSVGFRNLIPRPEERRVGKGGVSQGRARWASC